MLTKAEQDSIIEATVVAYRVAHWYEFGFWPAPDDNEKSFRAALRLDDKRLNHAIAWGAHKQPWQSRVTV